VDYRRTTKDGAAQNRQERLPKIGRTRERKLSAAEAAAHFAGTVFAEQTISDVTLLDYAGYLAFLGLFLNETSALVACFRFSAWFPRPQQTKPPSELVCS
jgi:hypothetical protein